MLTDVWVQQILNYAKSARIGLVGDLFLDRYLEIDSTLDEPSIETGLTAYQVTGIRNYPGALGTVLNNLVSLDVRRVIPISVIGNDGAGYDLLAELRQHDAVTLDEIVISSSRFTPTYTKPMRHENGVATELNRLDIKNRTPMPEELEDIIIAKLDVMWVYADVWIVLDQVSEEGCGVITPRVRQHIANLAKNDPHFVLADSRENIFAFENMSIKPNSMESSSLTGGISNHAKKLGRSVFVTDGDQGITVYEPDGTSQRTNAITVAGPIDPVGAGDSVSAGIALAMAAGADSAKAAAFGNIVASITVQQVGVTGTATPEQVWDRWISVADTTL